jgi:hypothetical protein
MPDILLFLYFLKTALNEILTLFTSILYEILFNRNDTFYSGFDNGLQ